jgi:hypothetical protein
MTHQLAAVFAAAAWIHWTIHATISGLLTSREFMGTTGIFAKLMQLWIAESVREEPAKRRTDHPPHNI